MIESQPYWPVESADKPWIFEFDKALDMLMECSLKRKRALDRG